MRGRRSTLMLVCAVLVSAMPIALPWAARDDTIVVRVATTDGRPIPQGTVLLRGPLNPTVIPVELNKLTDNDGLVVFKNLRPGPYSIRAQKQGFVGSWPNQHSNTSLVLVRAGQPNQGFVLVLKRGTGISGRITNANGTPAQGVRIVTGELGYQNGRKMLLPRESTITDGRGGYGLVWSGSAECYIYGESQPGIYAESPPPGTEQKIARTYYPGTVDVTKAKALPADTAGELSDINFALQQVSTYRVKGRILNLPPMRKDVKLMPPAFSLVSGEGKALDSPPYPAIIDKMDLKTGEFEISGIPAGIWTLFATIRIPNTGSIMNPAVPLISSGRIPISIADKDLDSITIQLSAVDVRGKVIITKPDINLNSGLPRPQVRVGLQPREAVPMEISIALQAFQDADADGSFEFHGVPPGKYGIVLSGVFPIIDIRVGQKSIINDGILSVGSKSPDFIQVMIESVNSGISGTVLGITPQTTVGKLSSTRVVLVPSPPRRQNTMLYRSMALSNVSGDFFFGAIPPGAYKVFAIKNLPAGAEQDPEVIARYETMGKSVNVDQGVSRIFVDWIQK